MHITRSHLDHVGPAIRMADLKVGKTIFDDLRRAGPNRLPCRILSKFWVNAWRSALLAFHWDLHLTILCTLWSSAESDQIESNRWWPSKWQRSFDYFNVFYWRTCSGPASPFSFHLTSCPDRQLLYGECSTGYRQFSRLNLLQSTRFPPAAQNKRQSW